MVLPRKLSGGIRPTPTVYLEYEDHARVMRCHAVELKAPVDVELDEAVRLVVGALQRTHPRTFGHAHVPSSVLERVVRRVLSANVEKEKISVDTSPSRGSRGSASPIVSPKRSPPAVERALRAKTEQFGDLQNAPDEIVAQAKEVMEEGFSKHRLRPGDDGYEYDVRVDFEGGKQRSEWDEDEGDDDEEEEEEDEASKQVPQASPKPSPSPRSPTKSSSQASPKASNPEEADEVDDEEDYDEDFEEDFEEDDDGANGGDEDDGENDADEEENKAAHSKEAVEQGAPPRGPGSPAPAIEDDLEDDIEFSDGDLADEFY